MNSIPTRLIILLATLILGCGKQGNIEKESAPEKPAVAANKAEHGVEEDRLVWNLRTLVGDYERAGNRHPKWDGNANEALKAFAEMRGGKQSANEGFANKMQAACQRAVTLGCDDPMIAYLNLRYNPGTNNDQAAETYKRTADQMLASGYSSVRKFYVALRASQAVKQAGNETNRVSEDTARLRYFASKQLIRMLHDRTTPLEEAVDGFHELSQALKSNSRAYAEHAGAAEKAIMERWPREALALLVRAEFNIQYGWHARGTGFADSVTEEGWKLFKEKLTVSKESLQTAWDLRPSDERIPLEMLTVVTALDGGRAEMEKWFSRAMALNTNGYDACLRKLMFLEPKWHGSPEAMLQFGTECVTSTNWGGWVPLILVEAHDTLERYARKQGDTNYWNTTGVWEDIKSSFDRFFSLCPDAIGWRHNYAKYAYRCERWDDLRRQIALLGPINYEYFGGKAEFEKMVRLAEEKSASRN